MHLAEINVARLRYPLEDPRVVDFVDNLEAINALAERSEGFVWRLKDESGNATQIAAYDDPLVIVNMSVWGSVEALHAFAYRTVHRRFVQRRQEWFELFDGPYVALWWAEEGAFLDVAEGRRRLDHLQRVGPTAFAFTFRQLFDPAPDIAPVVDTDETAASATVRFRLCG